MAHRAAPYPSSRPHASSSMARHPLYSNNSGASTPSATDRSAVSSPAPHTPPTAHEIPHSYTPPAYMPQTYPKQQYGNYPSYTAHPGYTGEQPTGYVPYGYPEHQSTIPLSYTDDAATKLNDRIRRRCFNCCSTDTSTWRRSSLSPGKILCNKCGLYERTHLRVRPQKFTHTHKKGSPTMRSHSTSNTLPQTQGATTSLPPNNRAPFLASLTGPGVSPAASESKVNELEDASGA